MIGNSKIDTIIYQWVILFLHMLIRKENPGKEARDMFLLSQPNNSTSGAA